MVLTHPHKSDLWRWVLICGRWGMLPISSVASASSQYQCAYIKCASKIGNWQHWYWQYYHIGNISQSHCRHENISWSKSKIILYNLAWMGLTVIDHLCYIIRRWSNCKINVILLTWRHMMNRKVLFLFFRRWMKLLYGLMNWLRRLTRLFSPTFHVRMKSPRISWGFY